MYNPKKTRVVYSEPNENEIDISDGPEEIMIKKEKIYNIEKILNDFSDREKEIINHIFGLSGHNPKTLREIGPEFNLTYERIRQIKNAVIDKLKTNEHIIEIR